MSCFICDAPLPDAQVRLGKCTCSPAYHSALIVALERECGTHKKIIDITTGIAYKVPTRHIIEHGVRWIDLPLFPRWHEDDEA